MSQSLNYTEVSKLQFTDEQIAAEVEAAGVQTKTIVTLDLGNIPGEELTPEVLTAFAALAKALKRNVTKNYNDLTVVRPLTEDEARESALQSLKYGYSERARAVRDAVAAEQGISLFNED